jgi:hypothetical protein
VRGARFAVIGQLRGRLHKRPAENVAPPSADLSGRLLYPALDLGAAGDEHCERELAYLSPLARQPGSVLSWWERDLTALPGELPTPGWPQDFLLRYCRSFDPDAPAAAEFLRVYHGLIGKVVQAAPSDDPAQAEDRERVLRWIDNYQALAERLACEEWFLQRFREFLSVLRRELLTPWDRALKTRRFLFFHRTVVTVPLSRAERLAIRDEEMAAALDKLVSAVQQGVEARRQRARAFEAALAQWRTWCSGASWVDAVARLETDALRQWHHLEAACRSWDRGWTQAVQGLRRCLTELTATLRPYASLLSSGTAREEVTTRLSRPQREALELEAAEEAATWLQESWPSPGETVEAVFALWELGGPTP